MAWIVSFNFSSITFFFVWFMGLLVLTLTHKFVNCFGVHKLLVLTCTHGLLFLGSMEFLVLSFTTTRSTPLFRFMDLFVLIFIHVGFITYSSSSFLQGS